MTDAAGDRADSTLLASLDKRLALLEQGTALGAKAAEAQALALTKSIEQLGTEVRVALASNAEPTSSPAGRMLLAGVASVRTEIEEHTVRIAAIERIRDELTGALRGIRVMVAIMSAVSVAISIFAVFRP